MNKGILNIVLISCLAITACDKKQPPADTEVPVDVDLPALELFLRILGEKPERFDFLGLAIEPILAQRRRSE